MSSADISPIHRPAVLIVDEPGPRRQELLRLCEAAGWLVQIVDAPPREECDLESLERRHIHRVLLANGGNVTRAARALGVHRRTLQRKLRQGPDAVQGSGADAAQNDGRGAAYPRQHAASVAR